MTPTSHTSQNIIRTPHKTGRGRDTQSQRKRERCVENRAAQYLTQLDCAVITYIIPHAHTHTHTTHEYIRYSGEIKTQTHVM